MGTKQVDLKQLRADLETLSSFDFEIKYPGLSTKTLRGLSMEELEKRISKISLKGGVGQPGFNF